MEAKCTLSDKELIEKSFEWVKKLADTGGRAWTLKVPVDFNNDPDILFVELGNRLKQLKEIASKMNTELQDGRDYLMEVKANEITVSDTLEAFGFGRNGLG